MSISSSNTIEKVAVSSLLTKTKTNKQTKTQENRKILLLMGGRTGIFSTGD